MATVSSYREASCQVRQRARPASTVAYTPTTGVRTQWRPLALSQRKVWSTAGQYAPIYPGLHAGYSGYDSGWSDAEK